VDNSKILAKEKLLDKHSIDKLLSDKSNHTCQ